MITIFLLPELSWVCWTLLWWASLNALLLLAPEPVRNSGFILNMARLSASFKQSKSALAISLVLTKTIHLVSPSLANSECSFSISVRRRGLLSLSSEKAEKYSAYHNYYLYGWVTQMTNKVMIFPITPISILVYIIAMIAIILLYCYNLHRFKEKSELIVKCNE